MNKNSSEKSIFANSRDRKSSPTLHRDETDSEKAFKLALSYTTAPLMAEGLIKQLDKNFQIPKLSARNAEDKKNKLNSTSSAPDASKMYDMITKNDVALPKYPMTLPTTKMFENNMEAKIRSNMNMIASTVTGGMANPFALTTTTTTTVNQ